MEAQGVWGPGHCKFLKGEDHEKARKDLAALRLTGEVMAWHQGAYLGNAECPLGSAPQIHGLRPAG